MLNSIAFLGAGASVPFGILTMTKMAEEFEAYLRNKLPPYLRLFDHIKYKLKDYENFDIEALITVLQDIIEFDAAHHKVFNQPSVHYFSSWGLNFKKMVEINKDNAKQNRSDADKLLKDVKGFIAECCTIKEEPFAIYDEFFYQIMKDGFDYRAALKTKGGHLGHDCLIFTTNYDRVVEAYWSRRGFNYECGELRNGVLDISPSNSTLYSPIKYPQIYKLHGSINWYVDQSKRTRWLTEAAQSGKTTLMGDRVVRELLIYPVQQKYTFREPFYSMFRYLKECLLHCQRCYVVGYSFRDDDILGLFYDAMELNERLIVYLIDINAPMIARYKFPNHLVARINPLPLGFSTEACTELG